MIQIQITDEVVASHPGANQLDERALLEAVRRTLQIKSGSTENQLTVVITDDGALHKLNKTYLGEDRPTDVLAFPSGDVDPELDRVYLGDVIISYPRAEVQARSAGIEILDEIRLLVIHGVLHLLGYDHGEPAAKAGMWAVQETILADLGIAVTVRG